MKKKLFFLAAAAVALASCSSDETTAENSSVSQANQPKEIAFSPFAQKATRAAGAVMNGTFPLDNSMEVSAYLTQPSTGSYFEKCTFNKDNTTGTWKGSKYWPLGAAKLNFFAVSGYGVSANNITIENDLSEAGVAYTTGNSYSATTQSDIMYAFGRGAVTQDGNGLNFNNNTAVSMVFKHALALVDFQVKGATATEAGAITINSISLKNAKYNGTLTLTNTNASTESGDVTTAVSWVAGDVVASVNVPGISTSTAITQSYARIGNGLMIIPGTGFDSFVINFSMNGHSYDYTYTPSPAVTSTTAATKYTYYITFKLHEIEIAPEVTPWTEENTVVEIPGITYAASGTPVINVPNAAGTYLFTVSGVPAGTYTVSEDTSAGDDIITAQAITAPAGGTLAAAGTLTISVTVTENSTGTKTRGIILNNGTSDVMTFNIKQIVPTP